MDKNLLGIYSFPKSGNTWMAMIVARLFFDGNLDAVPSIYLGRKNNFISHNGVMSYKSHDYCPVDISNLRFKNLFDDEFCKNNIRYLYIMRHPLDVFCSMMNWIYTENMSSKFICGLPKSIDQIKYDNEIEYYFDAFFVFNTLMPEFSEASRWDFNVLEWHSLALKSENINILKYEDMLADAMGTLLPIFSSYGFSEADIDSAINEANLSCEDGNKFFWRKQKETYLDYLSQDMIEAYTSKYSSTLKTVEY